MTPRDAVLVSQIPSIVDQLKAASWGDAAFTIYPPGERHSNKAEVRFRYSVENGKIVLDWSLDTRRGEADKDRIVAFIQERHHTVLQKHMRTLRFLRVEDGDVSQLGMQILQEFYHLPSNGEIGVFVHGFDRTKNVTPNQTLPA